MQICRKTKSVGAVPTLEAHEAELKWQVNCLCCVYFLLYKYGMTTVAECTISIVTHFPVNAGIEKHIKVDDV